MAAPEDGYMESVSPGSGFEEWLRMGLLLWPDHEKEHLKKEFEQILTSKNDNVFIYKLDNKYIGFIHVSIRNDYVEGSDSSPVGYVEGIYVDADYRKKGVARKLIKRSEVWMRDNGCKQIGSDIELGNSISYDFHTKAGFIEANKIICFIKDIDG